MATPPNAAGNRVREVRRRRGLTMEQVADKVGVHFTTIAKIERSMRGLSGEMLHKIAGALDVRPEDLVDDVPKVLPIRMVPIIGTIAAGRWREAVMMPDGYAPAPVGGEQSFALRPEGDSMDLVVKEGALIIVDPHQLDLRDGMLYAVMNGEGETTFKRFRADPPRLEPVSSNPDHQPIALGREPFTVIGRIVWQASPL